MYGSIVCITAWQFQFCTYLFGIYFIFFSAKAPWEPLTVLFIENKLNYADKYSRPPPYDTVKGFDCEGDGSDSGSLSSLNTSTPEVDHDFGQLNEWGSKFAKLAYMYNKYEDSD